MPGRITRIFLAIIARPLTPFMLYADIVIPSDRVSLPVNAREQTDAQSEIIAKIDSSYHNCGIRHNRSPIREVWPSVGAVGRL
jgi:hypothetical protein